MTGFLEMAKEVGWQPAMSLEFTPIKTLTGD